MPYARLLEVVKLAMERDRREEMLALLSGGRIQWDDYRQAITMFDEDDDYESKIEAALEADKRGDSRVVRLTKDGAVWR